MKTEKRNYDEYDYVSAEVIRRAALNDDLKAFEIIFRKYEKKINEAVRNALRKSKLSYDQTLFHDIKNTVCLDLREEVRNFRPR